jgi:hypothetical protein
MANNPVNKNDLINGDPIGDIKRDLDLAVKSLNAFDDELKSISKTLSGQFKKAQSDTLKGINDLNQAEIKAEKLLQEKNRTEQTTVKLSEQKRKILVAETKETERLARVKERETKATIKARKAVVDSLDPFKRLTKQVNTAQMRFKSLAAQHGVNSKQARRAEKDFLRLDNQLRKINTSAKDGRRDVGRYGLATEKMGLSVRKVTGLLAKFGLAMGGAAIVRSTFNIIKDFQQAQADLASVLGVNVTQMKALTDQAKELGSTTRFTAGEVSNLQTELAKLGFTQKQINDMTPATLALAEATGTDLAEAATVAGATLNGFGLEARDTQRVVDVMAKAFSSSSLDMAKFSTSMAKVAPIAKTMGFSLEETTAMLGALTDSGLDASTAGTSLKNMMLEAKKKGLTWAQALNKINTAQDKASASLELFGKLGAASGVILAENQEKVEGLTVALKDSEGAAAAMADTQRNTLAGSIDLLKSAWEGLVLSMDEAGGVGEKLRNGIRFLADNLPKIISLVFKLVKAFAVFKVGMLALKLSDQVKDFRALSASAGGVGKALKESSGGVGTFGRALKGLALGAAIALLATLAKKFFDVSTEARRTAGIIAELARRNDSANQAALNWVNQILDKEKQLHLDRMAAFDKELIELKKEGKTAEEIALAKHKALTLSLYLQKNAIGTQKGMLKGLLATAQAEQKISDQRVLNMSEVEKAQNKAASAFGLTSQPEVVLTSRKNDADVLRYTEELRLLAIEWKVIDQEATNAIATFNGFGKVTEKATISAKTNAEKQISLIRLITDERIKQIDDLETRDITQLRVSVARIIEDKNLTNASEEEKAEFAKQININLAIEIKAIRKRFRDEELEAERVFQEELRAIVLDSEQSEQSQIDRAFERERIDKRIELLSDFTLSKEEVEREYTKFLLKQNETRLLNVKKGSDEEKAILLQNAELRRSLQEDTTKDAEEEFLKAFIQIEQAVTDALEDEIDKRIKMKEDEKRAAKDAQDFFQQLAAEGNIEAQQSIKEQIQAQKEAQKEINRLEKQKANLQLISAGLTTFTKQIEGGAKPGEALATTALTTGALTSLLSGLINFFAVGTTNAPEGLAVVDEKGAELITDKKGNIKSFGTSGGARLTHLESGDIVHTAAQTANKMAGLDNANNAQQMSSKKDSAGNSFDLLSLQNSIGKSFDKSIKKMPHSNTDWTGIAQGLAKITVEKSRGNDVQRTNYRI